jgi:hypothetical protein
MADDKLVEKLGWENIKADLEAMGIFKLGGWLGKNLLTWVLQKNEDRFTTHVFNVYVAMPYAVVYVFEQSKYELEDENSIDGLRYLQRLSAPALARELSDEYRVQIVQGAHDSLLQSGKPPDNNETFLRAWIDATKKLIKKDANLTDTEWKMTLHIRNLDVPLVSSDLPKINDKLKQDIVWLDSVNKIAKWVLAALVAVILIFGAISLQAC